MATNILLETVIRVIHGNPRNAKLASLVAAAVPLLQDRVKRDVRAQVTDGAHETARTLKPWAVIVQDKGKRWERLLLCPEWEHWSPSEHHGVWFMFEAFGTVGGWVGVEWPVVADSFLAKSDLWDRFPAPSAGRQGHRHDGKKEWFARCPGGEEWWEWSNILGKGATEVQQYGRDIIRLMRSLVEVIDASAATHREGADGPGPPAPGTDSSLGNGSG